MVLLENIPFYLVSNGMGQDCRKSLCVREKDGDVGSVEEQNGQKRNEGSGV